MATHKYERAYLGAFIEAVLWVADVATVSSRQEALLGQAARPSVHRVCRWLLDLGSNGKLRPVSFQTFATATALTFK